MAYVLSFLLTVLIFLRHFQFPLFCTIKELIKYIIMIITPSTSDNLVDWIFSREFYQSTQAERGKTTNARNLVETRELKAAIFPWCIYRDWINTKNMYPNSLLMWWLDWYVLLPLTNNQARHWHDYIFFLVLSLSLFLSFSSLRRKKKEKQSLDRWKRMILPSWSTILVKARINLVPLVYCWYTLVS